MRNRGVAVFKSKRKPKVAKCSFVSAKGNRFDTAYSTTATLLFEESDDWQLQFDLKVECDGQSKNKPFPQHIVAASRRPDGVRWSDKLKTVAWVELTSPCEDNRKKLHFQKHENYSKLAARVRSQRWTLHPLCIEVGARGKTDDPWLQMAKDISIKGSESKKLRLRVAQMAQRCSYYLYLNRKNKHWHHPPLLPAWES